MKNTLYPILLTFLLSGCATVIKGADQTITFTSEPAGAEVLVDGISMGVTPLTVRLKKNKHSSFLIKKSGYKSFTRPLEKAFDAITLIGITSYSTPMTTDFVNGAAYEYAPNTYYVELAKVGADK